MSSRQFPKGLVPAYGVITTPYATDAQMEKPDGLSDLIHHIKKHHVSKGLPKPSSAMILDQLDKKSAAMGMSPEEGRGLFGNIWSGIKSGVQRAGSKLWEQFKADPLGSIQTVANLFAKDAPAAAAAV